MNQASGGTVEAADNRCSRRQGRWVPNDAKGDEQTNLGDRHRTPKLWSFIYPVCPFISRAGAVHRFPPVASLPPVLSLSLYLSLSLSLYLSRERDYLIGKLSKGLEGKRQTRPQRSPSRPHPITTKPPHTHASAAAQSADVFKGNFPGFGWMKTVPQWSKPIMMASVTGVVGVFYPQVRACIYF